MFGRNEPQEPDLEYFTIFDTKVRSYRDPILAANSQDMLRNIENTMRNPKFQDDQYVANAEDFQLFKVGSYYRKTGTIVACKPEHIANLHDIKASVMRTVTPTLPELGIVPT